MTFLHGKRPFSRNRPNKLSVKARLGKSKFLSNGAPKKTLSDFGGGAHIIGE